MIKVGSLFSGIGGMEIGLSRAIPNAVPVWFCEKEDYPRSILRKHWPGVPIYDNVKNINKSNVESIDILTGGFPCQSISLCGNMRGLQDDEKSGLWREMWRIIRDLRPRIVIMENVANVIHLGGTDVVGSLAEIGYCVEWEIVSAEQMGAPHLRRRWFAVAYPDGVGLQKARTEFKTTGSIKHRKLDTFDSKSFGIVTDPDGVGSVKTLHKGVTSFDRSGSDILRRGPSFDTKNENYWTQNPNPKPTICRLDDGIPDRVARLKALGNAIVPACSEYVGRCVVQSGLIDDLISGGEQ